MRKIAKPRFSGEPDDAREVVPQPSDQNALVQHDINAESEDMIRHMLAEQRRQYNRHQLPEILPDTSDETHHGAPAAASARAKRRKAWGEALDAIPDSHFEVDTDDLRQPRPRLLARLFGAKVKGRRTGVRMSRVKSWHVVLSAMVLLVVFKPMVIQSLLMGVFWGIICFSLIFGPGRVFEFLNGAWAFFLRRNPALATALRQTSDAVGLGAMAVLKRLPGNLDQRWAVPVDRKVAAEDDDPYETRLPAEVFRG